MIKFAFSELFSKALYILLFTVLTTEVFSRRASDYFQKPVQQCWESKNLLIDNFASDNNKIILSQTDGNIISLDKITSDQIWKTSIGNKNNSIIRLSHDKILVITLEDSTDSGNILAVRSIENLSGVVKDLKEFSGITKQIGTNDIKAKQIFYLNSKSEIGIFNPENESMNWFQKSAEISENTILNSAEIYFAFTEGSEITQIDTSNESKRQTIKTDSEEITALTSIGSSLFWGDNSGRILRKEADKKSFEKISRTGGKVSFLQSIDKNILITSNDNYLYFYSPKSRKLVWKKRLSGRLTIKPQLLENLIAVTTNAEPVIYFIDLKNGKVFNQISLSDETFIKEFQLDETSLYVHTNFGLIRYSEDCTK